MCKETRHADMPEISRVEMAPPRKVTPRDVWVMTRNALGRISCIKRELGLRGDVAAPARDPAMTPTGVFRSIVQANRQLNLLLERAYPSAIRLLTQARSSAAGQLDGAPAIRSIVQANRQLNLLLEYPFAPSDVFSIVTLSNEFIAGTLDAFIPEWRASEPPLPDYSGGMQPVDVFGQLLRCIAITERIAAHSGLTMLEFRPAIEQSIVPGDVFDLASLVFSEVRFFATQVEVRKRYTLRVHTEMAPSDVYQEALRLESLLARFEDAAQTNPGWHAND